MFVSHIEEERRLSARYIYMIRFSRLFQWVFVGILTAALCAMPVGAAESALVQNAARLPMNDLILSAAAASAALATTFMRKP